MIIDKDTAVRAVLLYFNMEPTNPEASERSYAVHKDGYAIDVDIEFDFERSEV